MNCIKREDWKVSMRNGLYFLCAAAIPLGWIACDEDTENGANGSADTEPTFEEEWDTALEGTVDIQGQATDSLGEPVAGAVVSVGTDTAKTTRNGLFALGNVPSGDVVVTVRHRNYIPTAVALSVNEDTAHSLAVSLIPVGGRTALDAARGGVALGSRGAAARFPGSAFVDADGTVAEGTVAAAVTSVDPSMEDVMRSTPGDFSVVSDGRTVRLESFGMLDVRVHGYSDPESALRLAPEARVEISIPVAERSDVSEASLPLWYFDESTATWVLSGEAKRSADGKTYVASVEKLGLWNLDHPYDTACIAGRLVDETGTGLSDKTVDLFGISYLGRDTVRTDENGRFFGLVKPDSTVSIQARGIFSAGWPPSLYALRSENVTALSGPSLQPEGEGETPQAVNCTDVGEIHASAIPYERVVIDGSYTIETEDDVAALVEIERIDGDLILRDTVLESVRLPALRKVRNLIADDNPNLAALSMPRLVSVKRLNLRKNAALTDLSGLGRLVRIGSLDIAGTCGFSDLKALLSLREVNEVVLYQSDGLESLSGLERIERLYSLTVTGSPTLRSLSGLDGLRSVSTLVELSRNTMLTDLSGLARLEYVGLDFFIVQNPRLESLIGLEQLSALGAEANEHPLMTADFSVYENASLPNCEAHRIAGGITFGTSEYYEVCIYDNLPDSCEELRCEGK